MIDTLNNLPIIRSYTDIIKTIATGYKIMGNLNLAQYILYTAGTRLKDIDLVWEGEPVTTLVNL